MKIQGYKTANSAQAAAKRLGEYGVTGSGRQCLPVQLPNKTWAYWTDHDYFHPRRDPGTLLVKGGKKIEITEDLASELELF